MKVLLSSASFSRAYGGPAYSVSRLGLALAAEGLEVGLWAPDNSAELARSLWLEPSPERAPECLQGSLGHILKVFGGIDIIHDSGLWRRHNHLLARQATERRVPRIVSTRGMLEPWAIGHKRVRKLLGWHLYQRRDLMAAQAVHVTSEAEADNVHIRHLKLPVWLLPNGIDLPKENQIAFQGDPLAPRRAVFLGRLHPVKGIPELLEAWSRAKPRGWELLVAGPDEKGYRALVEAAIARLGLVESVKLIGEVAASEKAALFRSAEILVLPSHSESFGMVVGEALAHGLPVITTTSVPWPQLTTARCGWRVAPEAGAIASALSEVLVKPRDELAEAGRRGRELVAREFTWSAIGQAFHRRYLDVLSGRKAHSNGYSSNAEPLKQL